MEEKKSKHKPLPASDDEEFWEDAEKHAPKPVGIDLCPNHQPSNWKEHTDYIDNKDGSISCMICPWGTMLPGFYRVHKGKIIDLRTDTVA